MNKPTQDKDTDLLHADGRQLDNWYLRHDGDHLESFVALRDEVKRQARVGYVGHRDYADSLRMCQVEVAQNHAKRIENRELAAENARLRAQLDAAEGQRVTAAWDAQVAEQRARRDGAREALSRCAVALDGFGPGFRAGSITTSPSGHVRTFRDREYPQDAAYPAPPPEAPATRDLPPHEPDLGRTGNPVQWCERCRIEASRPTATPAPAGEPFIELDVGLHIEGEVGHRVVRIAPADAARIVAMAREVGNG